MNIKPGDVIDGRYKVIEHLGDGGFATVFTALEVSLARTVAIKFLHETLYEKHLLRRFEQEGKILSQLDHTNIVRFYRFGLLDKTTPYIVMEYIQGKSLRTVLNESGPLELSTVLRIAQKLCDGLSEAHAKGVVHRDLKPDNIILADTDTPKIVDFGVSKILDDTTDSGKITRTGVVVGSVHYMSPEQCSGQAVDQRCDVYALGCIIYELITGEPPYKGDSVTAIMSLHLSAPPPMLGNLPGSAGTPPAGLNNFLQKILCKNIQDRFQSAREASTAIALLLMNRGEEIAAPPQPRKTAALPIAIILALLMMLGLVATECLTRGNNQKTVIDPVNTPGTSLISPTLRQPAELLWQAKQKQVSPQDYLISYYRNWLNQHETKDPEMTADANLQMGKALLQSVDSHNWNEYLERADSYYAKVIEEKSYAVTTRSALLQKSYVARANIATLRGKTRDAFNRYMEALAAYPGILQSPDGTVVCCALSEAAAAVHRLDVAIPYAKKLLAYDSITTNHSQHLKWTFRLAEYYFLCHKPDDGNKAMAEGLKVLAQVADPVQTLEGRLYYAQALRVKADFPLAIKTLDGIITSAKQPTHKSILLSALSMKVILLDRLDRTKEAIEGIQNLRKTANGITLINELKQVLIIGTQSNKPTKLDYSMEEALATELSKADWNTLIDVISQSLETLDNQRDKERLTMSLERFKQLADRTPRQ